MSGVSGKGVSAVVDAAAIRGITADDLAAGTGVDPQKLAKNGPGLAWEELVLLARNLGRLVGGPEGLRRLGEHQAANGTLGIFRTVSRAISDPRDLYFVGARWIGPSLFPMVGAEMSESPEGLLVQTLTIPPALSDCPELFHLIHGVLAKAPEGWGHGPSHVELSIAPRKATFRIRPYRVRQSLPRRFLRSVRTYLAFPSMVRELEGQQSEITAKHLELHAAHARIQQQALDLERVNSIGRRLSELIDLDCLTDTLLEILRRDLQAEAARLTIDALPPIARGEDGPELPPRGHRRETGPTQGAPSEQHRLVTGGRTVGQIEIWWPSEAPVSDPLLLRLLPWIAVAVENARVHAQLLEQAEDLQQRVQERTARLLATNHHLVREMEERKRTTDALLESEHQLRASERLASVGTLAAGIAHEINNPVGSILAAAQYASVIERETREGPQTDVGRALEDIAAQARRCGDIVRSVLQFSRDETTEKWPCRLGDILRRSLRLTQTTAESTGTIVELDLPDEPIWVRINPIQIEQAIVNLVRNAIEAGSRSITIRAVEDAAERNATIEVADDGRGIAEADRPRVTEPFYTTRREAGGTGLGLSVVHGIVAEHMGSLRLGVADEGGVCALVELPSIPPPPVPYDEKAL